LGQWKRQEVTKATKPTTRTPEDKQLAEELIERVRDEDVYLVGPDGRLTGLTKDVLEAGLEAELSEHLGYDKHDPSGLERGSDSRDGTRQKEVLMNATAISERDTKERFSDFAEVWREKYPVIIRLWENSWVEFAPFLDCSPKIRKVIYSTNAVASFHARMRQATRAKGHFPTEQTALKCLYPEVRSPDPTGRGRKDSTRLLSVEGRMHPPTDSDDAKNSYTERRTLPAERRH